MKHIIAIVQKEDLLKWAFEPINTFALENLWYPKDPEFTKLGWFLFANNK